MRIPNKFRIKLEYKFGLVLFGVVFNSFWFALVIIQFKGFFLTSFAMMLFSLLICFFGLFAPTLIDVVCPKCNYSVKEEHNYCPNCGLEFKEMRTLM